MPHGRFVASTERAAFYSAVAPGGLTAQWSAPVDIVTPEPKILCVPFLWRFDTVQSRFLKAAALITAKEAMCLVTGGSDATGAVPTEDEQRLADGLRRCPLRKPARK